MNAKKKATGATRKAEAKVKTEAKPKASTVVLLSGGNPQIAKGEGDGPVQAYIAALPGWKQPLGARIDAVIVKAVPNVKKAIKWNTPFYGLEGRGYFVSFHAFARSLKVTFFKGTSLEPMPAGASKSPEVRYYDVYEAEGLDEALLARWVKQAAALPGWAPSRADGPAGDR